MRVRDVRVTGGCKREGWRGVRMRSGEMREQQGCAE